MIFGVDHMPLDKFIFYNVSRILFYIFECVRLKVYKTLMIAKLTVLKNLSKQ